jgi:hypothetical protein
MGHHSSVRLRPGTPPPAVKPLEDESSSSSTTATSQSSGLVEKSSGSTTHMMVSPRTPQRRLPPSPVARTSRVENIPLPPPPPPATPKPVRRKAQKQLYTDENELILEEETDDNASITAVLTHAKIRNDNDQAVLSRSKKGTAAAGTGETSNEARTNRTTDFFRQLVLSASPTATQFAQRMGCACQNKSMDDEEWEDDDDDEPQALAALPHDLDSLLLWGRRHVALVQDHQCSPHHSAAVASAQHCRPVSLSHLDSKAESHRIHRPSFFRQDDDEEHFVSSAYSHFFDHGRNHSRPSNNNTTSVTESRESGAQPLLTKSMEEEAVRVRRLTSWGTMGTEDYTIGTSYSKDTVQTAQHADTASVDATMPAALPNEPPLPTSWSQWKITPADETVIPTDDDGRPIDPKIMQRALMMSEQRQYQRLMQQQQQQQQTTEPKKRTRRQRLVKFDYPPISRLREYPRPDRADIAKLFFTERELDQIEDDRECTFCADDVEVVAIASLTSSLSGDEANTPPTSPVTKPSHDASAKSLPAASPKSSPARSAPSPPPPAASPKSGKFGKYVATPRIWKKKKPPSPRNFNFETKRPGRRGSRTGSVQSAPDAITTTPAAAVPTAAPAPWSPASASSPANRPTKTLSSPVATPSSMDHRLIKSVQIYLRERSTGK